MKSFTLAALSALATVSLAQDATFDLGTAANFALLAVNTITIDGEVSVIGDVGSTAAVQGDSVADVVGTVEVRTADVDTAISDAQAAYNAAIALPGVEEPQPPNHTKISILDGDVFTPGVYIFPEQIEISGDITLSGAGTFVFVAGSKLTTLEDTNVILADGATAQNVLWAIGNQVALATSSTFNGNIITASEILMNGDVVATGSLIAMEIIDSAGTITNPN